MEKGVLKPVSAYKSHLRRSGLGFNQCRNALINLRSNAFTFSQERRPKICPKIEKPQAHQLAYGICFLVRGPCVQYPHLMLLNSPLLLPFYSLLQFLR